MTETQAIYQAVHPEVLSIGFSDASTKEAEDILNDPSCSNWLRWALRSSLHRDPVDAANDAEILSQLLEQRAELALQALATEDENFDQIFRAE